MLFSVQSNAVGTKRGKRNSINWLPSSIEANKMIRGFDPDYAAIDSSYCRFGGEALVKLLQFLESQMEGVEKSEDIEYVHKMRVASRRIRAVIPLFSECFPKKRYKRWLNEIKKITRFLGAARDLDVQILFVKEYLKRLQPNEPMPGMEALLERHASERIKLQSRVSNEIQELKNSRVLEQIASYCKRIKEATSSPFNLYSVREKAFWQISSKLDEFIAMEEYVHKENEILKHHEMRIKAKWLRYTLEVFAPLYQGELSDDIGIVKNFQDTLGELHDCDVWVRSIPGVINEIQKEPVSSPENERTMSEGNIDLLKFLEYIEQKRKSYYQQFVSLWDENKSKDSFEELRNKASAGFMAGEYRTKSELANPYVKIGLISDIHANLNALEAVIKDAENRGITVFLNAGDIIGFGAFPNEVIQALYSKNTLSVKGNFDLEVLAKNKWGKSSKKFAIEYTRKALTKSYQTYLRALPLKLEIEIAQKKFLLIHGTPDSIDEHLYHDTPDERFQEIAKKAASDIIVFGHSHEQFTKKMGDTLFINPGSVGRPGDGNPQAAYAAINVNPLSVELIRVNYDVETAADSLRRRGAPESYSQMLLRGLSLESIAAEDKAREQDMEKNCAEINSSTQSISQKYGMDIKHSEQVRKLSLELFDTLQHLHKLGKRERCWLECAAILHDIGLANGTKAHQKNTLKLILNDTQLPFTSVERQIIANIARYHRKGCPKNKDYSFKSLNSELKAKVGALAGILRLADGLDFSHQSNVEKVEAHVAFEYVTIEGFVRLNPVLEESAVNKKKDMFEQSFNKKVMLAWKQIQPLQQQTSQQPELTQQSTPAPDGNVPPPQEATSKPQQTSSS